MFNGTSATLSAPTSVLVRGKAIAGIVAGASVAPGATVIEGSGRTLMPGMIDARWHLMLSTVPLQAFLTADPGYWQLAAGKGATEMLMRGFTSARVAGGPVFGLKRAVDEGMIPGPRIWPARAVISQTSGHGDYRSPLDLPWPDGALHFSERVKAAAIADGAD